MSARIASLTVSARASVALMLAILPVHSATAQASDRDSGWHFNLAPYVWLPTVNANLQFSAPSRPIIGGGGGASGDRLVRISNEIGPNDYLSDLNMALMVAATAEKDRWSINADLMYLSLSSENSTIGSVERSPQRIPIGLQASLGTETDLKAGVLTVSGGYEVLDSERAAASVIFGARYLQLDADLDWNLQIDITGADFVLDRRGRTSRDADLLDALIGFKGKVWLGDSQGWYVPYYVDVGAGSSKTTWQAMAGVGYKLEHSDLLFVYRHLDYDNDDNDALLQDLSLSGPAFGWSFRF